MSDPEETTAMPPVEVPMTPAVTIPTLTVVVTVTLNCPMEQAEAGADAVRKALGVLVPTALPPKS